MKTWIVILLTVVGLNSAGQNFKGSFEMLKSELEKKEAKDAMANSVYWQNSTAALIRFSSLGHGTIQTFDTRYEGVKGSPYLYEDWQKGAVLISGTAEPQPALLNYECVNGQLLVRMSDGLPSSLPVDAVKAFLIADESQSDGFNFFVSDTGEKGGKTFYQVIYNENTVLYQHLKKHFKPADYQRAYNPDRRFDEFEWDIQYFIKKENGVPEKVKLNPKAIVKLFPEKEKELNKYISDNKLKIRSAEEITKVLSYYDSL
jgi:hypothetical protein